MMVGYHQTNTTILVLLYNSEWSFWVLFPETAHVTVTQQHAFNKLHRTQSMLISAQLRLIDRRLAGDVTCGHVISTVDGWGGE